MRINFLLVAVILFIISCNKTTNTSETASKIPVTNSVVTHDTIAIPDLQHVEEAPIQLIAKHNLTDKDVYADYDGGSQLADYFLIEIIDKETFDKNKSMAVNMLSPDTTGIEKQKGIIKLPCDKGEISFVDNLSGGENHKEYTFIGQIQYLNVYVLSGIYWEDWNFFFVDKNAGSTVQTFSNRPYLSADGKYIISIDFDTFEGITYIDLYEVCDNRYVDPLIGMYAKKWIPIHSPDSMFWGNDNFLYIPVIHNQDYWAADGNYFGLDQYIRLKPIAS
ncbi:hypothetical protein LJC00_01370 [Dysgonomonas sp. OttesenSCG-928-M03]|nr:hypothetical protein [Dysgonomonas sp. OttesenSCG-928-M03]